MSGIDFNSNSLKAKVNPLFLYIKREAVNRKFVAAIRRSRYE